MTTSDIRPPRWIRVRCRRSRGHVRTGRARDRPRRRGRERAGGCADAVRDAARVRRGGPADPRGRALDQRAKAVGQVTDTREHVAEKDAEWLVVLEEQAAPLSNAPRRATPASSRQFSTQLQSDRSTTPNSRPRGAGSARTATRTPLVRHEMRHPITHVVQPAAPIGSGAGRTPAPRLPMLPLRSPLPGGSPHSSTSEPGRNRAVYLRSFSRPVVWFHPGVLGRFVAPRSPFQRLKRLNVQGCDRMWSRPAASARARPDSMVLSRQLVGGETWGSSRLD